ncbi:choice-of-anchor D domain-containing protein, partial [bacterium]|nr:choice-of-anchor D domain-containing protein [bacterium]
MTGFINDWWEGGPALAFDYLVPVQSGILGWWSRNTATHAWFYGYNESTEVAHVTGISDISEIADASIYPYDDWAVGPVGAGEFVLFHNTATGYYAALRIDRFLDAGARIDLTWYFQSDGSPDFSSFTSSLAARFFTDNRHEGIAPYTVQFSDFSSATDSTSIISWEWDFEDDGIVDSQEQNPAWTFVNEGVYSVRLTVSDGVNTATWVADRYLEVQAGNTMLLVSSRHSVLAWSVEPVYTRSFLTHAQACEQCYPLGYGGFDQTWGPLPVPDSKIIAFQHFEACEDGSFDIYAVDASEPSAAGTLVYSGMAASNCTWSGLHLLDISFLAESTFFLRIDNHADVAARLQKFAVVSIPLQAGPQISVFPANIAFGTVMAGEASPPAMVTIRNAGTADLTVSSIISPGAPFALDNLPALPLVLAAGETAPFDASFSPQQPGVAQGTIVIASDDADDPEVQLSLTGYGIVPGVALAFESVRVSDYAGNQDGIANGGEQIELPAKLRNNGTEAALGVQATITSTSPYVTIYGNNANFGTVATGVSEERYGWYMRVAEGTPESAEIEFSVTITATNAGPFTDSFAIITGPPLPAGGPLVLDGYVLDDSQPASQEIQARQESRRQQFREAAKNGYLKPGYSLLDSSIVVHRAGNGDGIINGGEIIDIYPRVRNDGAEAYEVRAYFNSPSEPAIGIDTYVYFGTISAGETRAADNPWTIGIKLGTPAGTVITLEVVIDQLVGGSVTETLVLTTGPSLGIPPAAEAGALLASNTYYQNQGYLYSLDPGSGSGAVVGVTGLNSVEDLAANQAGDLFAIGYGYLLLRINPVTGAGLFVARLRNAVSGSYLYSVGGLAFNGTGELYGIRSDSYDPSLYRIDIATGEATLVGNTGVSYLLGLSFNPTTGALCASRGQGSDEIYKLNPATGAATLVGQTGFASSISDLAFDSTGVLYGLTSSEGSNPWSLITIDTSTAVGTLVGATGVYGLAGLTFVPPRQSGGQIAVHPSHAEFGNV